MEHIFTYRPYREADFPAVVQLIQAAWHYEELFSPREARHTAELELLRCLRTQTFSQIALLDGRPVGFLFGELTNSPPRLIYESRIRLARRGLTRTPRGAILFALSRGLIRLNQSLLRRCAQSYGAKLSYFALEEECRGQGVGKALFQSFLCFLNEHRVRDFYLFTNTRSNYGFYEHFHMIRRQSRRLPLPLIPGCQVGLFLYDGQLPLP